MVEDLRIVVKFLKIEIRMMIGRSSFYFVF